MALIIALSFIATRLRKRVIKHKNEWSEEERKKNITISYVIMIVATILLSLLFSIHEKLPDTVQYDKEYMLGLSMKGDYSTIMFHFDDNEEPMMLEIVNADVTYKQDDDADFSTVTFRKAWLFNIVSSPIPYRGYKAEIKYTTKETQDPTLEEKMNIFLDYMEEIGFLDLLNGTSTKE